MRAWPHVGALLSCRTEGQPRLLVGQEGSPVSCTHPTNAQTRPGEGHSMSKTHAIRPCRLRAPGVRAASLRSSRPPMSSLPPPRPARPSCGDGEEQAACEGEGCVQQRLLNMGRAGN